MTTQREAELELENLRLREAIIEFRNEKVLQNAHGIRRTSGYSAMQYAVFDAPPITEALSALIEKVEKLMIERCAEVCDNNKVASGKKTIALIAHNLASVDCEEAIRALPTGQINLEDLL